MTTFWKTWRIFIEDWSWVSGLLLFSWLLTTNRKKGEDRERDATILLHSKFHLLSAEKIRFICWKQIQLLLKGKQQLQKKHLENEFLKIAEQKCGPQEVQRCRPIQRQVKCCRRKMSAKKTFETKILFSRSVTLCWRKNAKRWWSRNVRWGIISKCWSDTWRTSY